MFVEIRNMKTARKKLEFSMEQKKSEYRMDA